MLVVHDSCKEHMAATRDFAAKTGQTEKLEARLKYLEHYACPDDDLTVTRTTLYKDFAPYSFEFIIQKRQSDGSYATWFNGGLIYHGKHDGGGDGGAPTYAVCVEPSDDWEIHT